MYEYIKGKISDIYEEKVVIECFGIGYLINITMNTLTKIDKSNEEIKLYIHEHIREDEMSFYGFYDKNEREIFRNLISISGIGPKVGLGILSKFQVNELLKYISTGDEKALSSVPGIGKKTANRIILELKDKFKNKFFIDEKKSDLGQKDQFNNVRSEVVEALMSLGYSYNEAMQLIDKVYNPEMNVEELLKHALSRAAIN
ncbi:MAG: Holliday junction branch migration protein RuvA [Eubacteriaceae bacterium]